MDDNPAMIVTRGYQIRSNWDEFPAVWRKVAELREKHPFHLLFAVGNRAMRKITWAFTTDNDDFQHFLGLLLLSWVMILLPTAAEGHWTRFFEVRIAAGPTVKIERCPGSVEGYRVAINWGTQEATTEADSLPLSIQTADRLAKVFYDARNQASPIRR